MSVFLTDTERKAIKSQWDQPVIGDLFWQAIYRAMEDASQPGLRGPKTTLQYWHMAFETLSNASMIHALKPNDNLATWIRSATLELARRSDDEWIGPWFRNHTRVPSQGNLETAHLSWACASALDLAPEVFSSEEREEIKVKLLNTALPLCREFLETTNKINNWNSILMAGIAVTATVLDERENMDYAARWFERILDLFQNDGSYAESLQYSHYAQQGLFLTYEALVRRNSAYAEKLSPDRYGRGVRWTLASYLYHKPLEDWGSYPRPRSINFNDSAAMFRPQADLLLHINVRCSDSQPDMAGMARWLFDEYYTGERAKEPNDRASFGFYNHAGFLTLPLLSQAGAPLAPKEAGIKPLECFSNGDAIMRDAIDGTTIVAVYGGADDLHVRAHRHDALNSGVVVHNRERILVDPGHSCYRGLLHGVET